MFLPVPEHHRQRRHTQQSNAKQRIYTHTEYILDTPRNAGMYTNVTQVDTCGCPASGNLRRRTSHNSGNTHGVWGPHIPRGLCFTLSTSKQTAWFIAPLFARQKAQHGGGRRQHVYRVVLANPQWRIQDEGQVWSKAGS